MLPAAEENFTSTPTEIRLTAIETRLTAVQVDLAVLRNSAATKDDVQRILPLLYEHKLEFQAALARQREESQSALTSQREDFQSALAAQRDSLQTSLTHVQVDLHKAMMSHMGKLYGFAPLLLGGVYFIARYVY